MSDRVERHLELATDIEQAWEAVTSPHWLAQWLADEVDLEPWAGGAARFRHGESEREGWIEEFSPPGPDPDRPAYLVFWWSEGEESASRVELTLAPVGEGVTAIRVIETRPLEGLELVGRAAPEADGSTLGPTLVAA